MIYTTNPKKQRQYDRTDYQKEPYWIQRRPVRTKRLLRAVLIPAALGGAGLFFGGRGRPFSAHRVGDDRLFAALHCAVAHCDHYLEKRPCRLPRCGHLPV